MLKKQIVIYTIEFFGCFFMSGCSFCLSETGIYQLAYEVFNNIRDDINDSMYKKMGGSLSISWREQESFNASAQILNKYGEAPNHKIYFNYYLVKELYDDAVSFVKFVRNVKNQPDTLMMLTLTAGKPLLPDCFSESDCVRNIFMAALTFIFFHELGHLLQQHARVRSKFSNTSNSDFIIDECELENYSQLTEKQAAIYHTTELLADYSATTRCITELIRQFSSKELIDEDDNKGEVFMGAVQLFVTGISSLFYRFRCTRVSSEEEKPTTTHPQPLTRLEMNLPHIYEMLCFLDICEIMEYEQNRDSIVKLVTQAASTSSYFWLQKTNKDGDAPENYFIKGLLGSEVLKKYMNCIISTWDEIKPLIDTYNLDELPLTTLSFTNELRNAVKQ